MTKAKNTQTTDPDPAAAAIETVDELAAAYPDIVHQIKDYVKLKTTEAIEEMSVEQIKDKLPKVYATVTKAYKPPPAKQTANVKGFLLDFDDPFAAGTLRTFGNLTSDSNLRLPYVMPYKNRATKPALINYLVRISSSDPARAKAAKDALKECK